MITHRVSMPSSRSSIAVAMASRISWSSALRFSGLRMVSRATASAGRSSTSFPEASSLVLKNDQRIALADRLALLHRNLLHGAGVLGLDRHLHLHRLEDHDGVSLVDRVAGRDLDLPDGAGDVSLDVGQVGPPESLERGRRQNNRAVSPEPRQLARSCRGRDRAATRRDRIAQTGSGAARGVRWCARDRGGRRLRRRHGRGGGPRRARSSCGAGPRAGRAAPRRWRRGGRCRRAASDERVFVLCDGDLGRSAGQLGPLVGAVEAGRCDLAVAAFATQARRRVRRRGGVRALGDPLADRARAAGADLGPARDARLDRCGGCCRSRPGSAWRPR